MIKMLEYEGGRIGQSDIMVKGSIPHTILEKAKKRDIKPKKQVASGS